MITVTLELTDEEIEWIKQHLAKQRLLIEIGYALPSREDKILYRIVQAAEAEKTSTNAGEDASH